MIDYFIFKTIERHERNTSGLGNLLVGSPLSVVCGNEY